MGFYDVVWSLHSCFRSALVYENEAAPQEKRALMVLWRDYLELNVADFGARRVPESDLDDLASECLLDVILGPDEQYPCGTPEELAQVLRLDPKLFEYCVRRTSPTEIFNILKDKPPLVHSGIIRQALRQATEALELL